MKSRTNPHPDAASLKQLQGVLERRLADLSDKLDETQEDLIDAILEAETEATPWAYDAAEILSEREECLVKWIEETEAAGQIGALFIKVVEAHKPTMGEQP
jgi:hypothetical protein